VSELLGDLERLEKLTDEESREIKKELLNLSETLGAERAVDIESSFRSLRAVNNELIELAEKVRQEDYVGAHYKLRELERKRESVASNAFEDLRSLDKEHGLELEKLERNLEKVEGQFEEDLKQQALEQAQQRISDRPTVFVEEKYLERFLEQVQQIQIDRGEETAGVFHFSNVDNGMVLDNYIPLDNELEETEVASRAESFKPGDQEEGMIEDSERLVFAHSHPGTHPGKNQIELKSHSGMDQDYMGYSLDLEFGLLAAPDPEEDWIWLVPQMLRDGDWTNLRLQITRDGRALSEAQIRNSYPQVLAYNKSIVRALAYRRLMDSESDWLHYYKDHAG